jgi:RNA polymerase-binding transcription factor DksA
MENNLLAGAKNTLIEKFNGAMRDIENLKHELKALANEKTTSDDDIAELFERRERILGFIKSKELLVKQINHALEHYSSGDYGYCAFCGDEMPESVIKKTPQIIYHAECQIMVEQQSKRLR